MDLIFNPVFLSILFFGSATSYIDIKYGKIKNISVLLLIIVGFVINIFFTKTLSAPSLEINSYFFQTISNVIIATIFGFCLWLAGLLSEGDAKLFIGFSILLPVFLYKFDYLFLFPSIAILINTVIPVAIFLIIKGLIRVRKNQIERLKIIYSFNTFLSNILFIFSFSILLQTIFYHFNLGFNLLLQTLVLFIIMEILNKFLKKNILHLSITISIVVIIFFYNSILSVGFITQFLALAVLFQCLVIIFYVVDFSFGKDVKIGKLKVGMVVGDRLVKVKGSYLKSQSLFLSLFDLLKSVKDYYSQIIIRKLENEDVKNLQRLDKQGKLKFDTLKIVEIIPFAPFMFFGVLLTYLLQGSLFYYIHF